MRHLALDSASESCCYKMHFKIETKPMVAFLDYGLFKSFLHAFIFCTSSAPDTYRL